MKILRAFCVELGWSMNIFEATEAFFEQSEPRKRFNFLCSDDRCRERCEPTKIIGVNYDKIAEVDETFRARHFKNNSASPEHAEDCEWIEREIALKEVEKEEESKLAGTVSSTETRSKGLKTTNAIQVFSPKRKKKDNPFPSAEGGGEFSTNLTGTREERIKRYKREITEGITETSILENLTDDYRSMTKEERLAEPLTIRGGGTETYYSFIMPIFACRNPERIRIYHGNASVRKSEQGFSLWFYDKIGVRSVKLHLASEKVEKAPKRLRIQLDEAAKKGNYALCYFFGNMALSEEYPEQLNVEIESMAHMVVYPIASRRKIESPTVV